MTRTVLLGDVAYVTKLAGYEFTKYITYDDNGEIVALRALNLKDGRLDLTDVKKISREVSEKLPRSKLVRGDILLSYTGTVGNFAIVSQDNTYHLAPNVCLIRAGKECLPEFLYYTIASPSFKHQLIGSAHGSTQATVPMKNIRQLTIDLPPPEEQKKIVEVLGAIDEKIELNRKMNETLDQMSQALFRHYFIVNNDAEKWKEAKIGELADVTDYVANGSFASLKENVTLYDEPEYALYVRTTDHKSGFSGNLKYVDKKSFDFLKKSKLKGGEFIISNVGDVGTVFRPPSWIKKPMTLGSNAIMIKENEYTNFLYMYFRGREGQFALSNIVAGSAQPKFNKTEFRALKITQPDAATLRGFNQVYSDHEVMVSNNLAEIQTLITLRDSLLPRLISGKIKI